jgi:hypothetical protein
MSASRFDRLYVHEHLGGDRALEQTMPTVTIKGGDTRRMRSSLLAEDE